MRLSLASEASITESEPSLSAFIVLSLKQSSPNLQPFVTFNTDLGLFTSLCLLFWPLSHLSLHHCHSTSNYPAIVASPHTMRPTANLYSGSTHLSPGSLRRAVLSPPTLWRFTVVPAALGSLLLHLNLFASWEFALNLAGVNWFAQHEIMSQTFSWGVCDKLHVPLLILT